MNYTTKSKQSILSQLTEFLVGELLKVERRISDCVDVFICVLFRRVDILLAFRLQGGVNVGLYIES